jgi:hypothetical protein
MTARALCKALFVASLGGCWIVAGVDDFTDAPPTEASTDNGGSGGTTTSSTGGGGSGPGGSSACDSLHVFLLQDVGEATPPGWGCVSCEATDAFFARFPVGAGSFGNTGGSATHQHTFTVQTAANSGSFATQPGSATFQAESGHSHTDTMAMTEPGSSLPLYRDLKVIRPLEATAILPLGALVMIDTTALPSADFEAYTAEDGFFVRGGGGPAIGGGLTHVHTFSTQVTPYQSSQAPGTINGPVSVAIDHSHQISGGTDSVPITAPHVAVLLARVAGADGVPFPPGMLAMFDTTPGDAWTVLSAGGGSLDGAFLFADAVPSLVRTGASSHGHAQIATTTGQASATADFVQGGQSISVYGHTHDALVTFGEADNRPPYVETIVAKLGPAGCH